MSKKEIAALVPKYRFPEFADSGPVICENGNLIFEPISNKNHNSDLPVLAITQEYGAIPRDEIDYTVSVTEKSLEGYKVVEKGDFIISLRSFQGGIEYSVYHGICSPAYIILRKKIDIEEQYYRHYFKSYRFIRDLNKDLEGLRDGKMVSYSQFSAILLPKPDKKEQQKIADCLSSIDDLIVAEDKKLSTLRAHKNGLMQKLFPDEGKTLPEWRFHEFKDSGEWEEKTLDSFFSIGSSKRVLQENWTDKGVPFYRTRELVSLSKGEPFGSEIFISEQLYSELAKTYGLPTEGDFLVSGVGTLGICYQVKKEDKFYFKDGNVLWFKLNQGLWSSFFKYCFQSDYIQNQIFNQTSKSTVGTYTIQNAKRTKMLYTKNILEQQKISDCLSYVDNLISAQAKRIEVLKQHKKALIQGLFPSIEEVEE
ncbi:MAG: restriction modification system specificity domain protein [Lachnospiraceae bacterium]|jgi:type I restriction enzyme S subunit|nr:restriction modification system specificity domain protein [Lachnospiraceae bacterium]